jgi:hypothetical protein
LLTDATGVHLFSQQQRSSESQPMPVRLPNLKGRRLSHAIQPLIIASDHQTTCSLPALAIGVGTSRQVLPRKLNVAQTFKTEN